MKDNKVDVEIDTDDVSGASGYTFESRVKKRIHGGWGGTQTRLPKGHACRRDAEPVLKQTGK